ncbi:hypothetical protein AB0G73_30610 [Streptomyces sp. NPDC020719]|uniref:hypothetical protein n=1 Tax=Streptomyces sp. NPDC020719 TaxID=3154896 RepID=UPI0033E445D1
MVTASMWQPVTHPLSAMLCVPQTLHPERLKSPQAQNPLRLCDIYLGKELPNSTLQIYLRGEVHSTVLPRLGKVDLLKSEMMGAKNLLSLSLSPLTLVSIFIISDIQAKNAIFEPCIHPEKGVCQWMNAHIETAGAHMCQNVQLTEERIVGVPDAPLQRVFDPARPMTSIVFVVRSLDSTTEHQYASLITVHKLNNLSPGRNATTYLEYVMKEVTKSKCGIPITDGIDRRNLGSLHPPEGVPSMRTRNLADSLHVLWSQPVGDARTVSEDVRDNILLVAAVNSPLVVFPLCR